MEKKEINQEMIDMLRSPLPAEAIKAHPTKPYLSSIKAIYVTERLSDVFGVGSWKINTEIVERGDKGMVVAKVKLSIPEYGIELESYGGNDNGGEQSKNFDLGDAYKGAVTDAITKIGSWLYIGIDVFKGINSSPKTQKKSFPSKKQDEKKFMEVAKMLHDGSYTTAGGEVKKFTIGTIEAKYILSGDVKRELLDETLKMQS